MSLLSYLSQETVFSYCPHSVSYTHLAEGEYAKVGFRKEPALAACPYQDTDRLLTGEGVLLGKGEDVYKRQLYHKAHGRG